LLFVALMGFAKGSTYPTRYVLDGQERGTYAETERVNKKAPALGGVAPQCGHSTPCPVGFK